MSTAPLLINCSAISSACSPVSGCATIKLSISTPKFLAYTGSRACSASIKAATPPSFCASAIACSATVVLPDDSGPYTSTILPLGNPPIPSAISRLKAPVGIQSTETVATSPSFITEPFPKFFSICAIAISKAFFLSSDIIYPSSKHSFIKIILFVFCFVNSFHKRN